MHPGTSIKILAIEKKLRLPLLILIGLLPGLFVSGQAKFSTTVSSREIGKDDYLQVEFSVENASTVDQFTPPSFNGFQVMQEPSQSSETNVINGHVSQKQGLTYTLKPLKTGKFVIGGASALVDGKKIESNPVTITVTTASTVNKGNNGNNNGSGNNPFNPFPQLSWPGFQGAEPQAVDQEYAIRPGENVKEKIRKNLFVKVQVDKTSCYVGEPIVATYKLYSRVRSESRVTKHPSLNGFSVYDMIDPGTDASSVEKLNGRSYIVHIIRKAQLIPLQAGTIDLDPVEVENTVHFVEVGKRGSRGGDGATDPFEQLFGENSAGREVQENATVATQPLAIMVKPLPDENKPVDYTGAVGKFSIRSALVNRNINAEDEADLKVTVSGSGNLTVVSAPQVHWPSGIEAFDPTAKEEVNKAVAPLSGTKTFDYLFTTRDPGHYTIPPVSLSYFDPASRVYKKIQSDPLAFEVLPAAKKKALPAGVVAAGADQDEGLKALIDRHLESIFAVLILSCLAF